jgi:hypothetical protein
MKTKIYSTALLGLGLLCNSLGAAPQDGKWQVSSKVEFYDVKIITRSADYTQCLSGGSYVPQSSDQVRDCKVSNQVINGNKVSWSVQCQGKSGDLKGTGLINYNEDTFSGDVTLTNTYQGRKMTINHHLDGKRLGACS